MAAVLGMALLPAVIGSFHRFTPSGFTATGTESTRADHVISEEFDQPSADLIFLVSGQSSVKSGEGAASGRAVTRSVIGRPGVARVWSYWDTADPALLSADERHALIGVELIEKGARAVEAARRIVPDLAGTHGKVAVAAAGPVWSNAEAVRLSREDLRTAELAAAPLVLLILMVTLRSVALPLLPMVLGAVSVSATLTVLNGLTLVMPVSVFAVNVTAALGFGLSVDYGLLVMMRCREEMARGETVAAAVRLAAGSAGRAVLFSAATVIACMTALLIFPVPFLRSLAVGAIAVVALAALTTVLGVYKRQLLRCALLPATRLDQWLSDRVPCRPRLPGRGETGTASGASAASGYSKTWAWLGNAATRRPVLLGSLATVLLLSCAMPLGRAQFGIADERVLPESTQVRQTSGRVRNEFPDAAGAKLPVVLTAADTGTPSVAANVDRYARRLSSVEAVAGVDTFTGSYRGGHRFLPRRPPDRSAAAGAPPVRR